MPLTQNTNDNYNTRQLKLPLEIEKLIEIADPVYTFCEVMDHIRPILAKSGIILAKNAEEIRRYIGKMDILPRTAVV